MRKNDREKQTDKVLDRMLDESESKIGKAYAAALKNINAEIALMYSKVDGDPSLAEMSKYNNLRNRQKSIAEELTKLFRGVRVETLSTMEAQWLEAYYRNAHDLEFQAQQRLGFGRVNPKVIEESINRPISGKPIRERFSENRRKLLERLDGEITQSLIRGEGYREMSRIVRERMDIDLNRALTTARTEVHRMQTEARLKSIEEAENNGIEIRRVWDAELGKRTRDAHRRIDGQEANEDGEFEYKGYTARGPGLFGKASLDINCRCAVRERVEGYEDNIRRARNSDGTYETTAKDYDEWLKQKDINRTG